MKRHTILGLAVALLLVAAPLSASTFVAMSDVELVSQSDAVVVGEILETRSFWNQDMSIIVTEATVYVEQVVHGDAPALLTVRTVGGEVANYKIEAHGFPAFARDQRQVLFLNRTEDGLLQVTGYQQGQWNVRERSDGVPVAIPVLEGMQLLSMDGTPAPRPRAMTLDALIDNVRETAARGVDRAPIVK